MFSPQDIAVIKIVGDDGKTLGCYASPLNDKEAANPSKVRKSFDVEEVGQVGQLYYITSI